MKIINTTYHKTEISTYVKDVDGSDVLITLKYQEFTFVPTEEKTKGINLHGLKRNLGLILEDKPNHLEYFKPYPKLDLIETEFDKTPVVEESYDKTETSLQDSINLGCILQKVEESSEVALFDKSKKAIGANETELYSDLDLDEIKKSVEEYATEEVDTEKKPKPRTRAKRGPGRPKKKGRKPVKKSPGRPKGSKNKKK